MDSHIHFGINSAAEDRLALRKKLTCSPLLLDRYTETYTWDDIATILPPPTEDMEDPATYMFDWDALPSTHANTTQFKAFSLGESLVDGTNATYIWNSAAATTLNSGNVAGSGPAYRLQ